MNKILPFIRLDFYTLKPYKISLLMLLVIAVIMTMAFQSLSLLCFYLMTCLVMVTSYPFSIGETNRLDTLYATLPLNRKNVVLGRYALVLFMEVVVSLLAVIASFTLSIFTAMEFAALEILFYLCIASFVFTLIVAIQYPVYFKIGYNKAKFVVYALLLIVFLSVILLSNLMPNTDLAKSGFDDLLQLFAINQFLIYIAPVAAGHLLLALSCLLSCKIYGKRDI